MCLNDVRGGRAGGEGASFALACRYLNVIIWDEPEREVLIRHTDGSGAVTFSFDTLSNNRKK